MEASNAKNAKTFEQQQAEAMAAAQATKQSVPVMGMPVFQQKYGVGALLIAGVAGGLLGFGLGSYVLPNLGMSQRAAARAVGNIAQGAGLGLTAVNTLNNLEMQNQLAAQQQIADGLAASVQ